MIWQVSKSIVMRTTKISFDILENVGLYIYEFCVELGLRIFEPLKGRHALATASCKACAEHLMSWMQ